MTETPPQQSSCFLLTMIPRSTRGRVANMTAECPEYKLQGWCLRPDVRVCFEGCSFRRERAKTGRRSIENTRSSSQCPVIIPSLSVTTRTNYPHAMQQAISSSSQWRSENRSASTTPDCLKKSRTTPSTFCCIFCYSSMYNVNRVSHNMDRARTFEKPQQMAGSSEHPTWLPIQTLSHVCLIVQLHARRLRHNARYNAP